ncbi:hypothetical protein FJT64_000180 [Amphibalanus amphitrite]|uniref:Uncharacterized protein n=1 Tax=Amphibalanus amphitrite TaxID=1232801 RepID=A0A6A4VF29_AMPAM|nr:hypothetical protein FJT64_000180 [Amphibalanus amphitrite]
MTLGLKSRFSEPARRHDDLSGVGYVVLLLPSHRAHRAVVIGASSRFSEPARGGFLTTDLSGVSYVVLLLPSHRAHRAVVIGASSRSAELMAAAPPPAPLAAEARGISS